MLVHDLIYYRYPIQGKHLEPNSKTGKNDILFKDRNPVKNHTLLGGKTYLPNTYMGVPPPPPGIHQAQTTVPHSVCSRLRLEQFFEAN